jgi:hypothetical protein
MVCANVFYGDERGACNPGVEVVHGFWTGRSTRPIVKFVGQVLKQQISGSWTSTFGHRPGCERRDVLSCRAFEDSLCFTIAQW